MYASSQTKEIGTKCTFKIVMTQTRFKKMLQDYHPGQRPRWQVDKEATGLSRVQHLQSMCNPPSSDVSTLSLNIFTLLAVTQSVDNLIH